MRNMKRRSRRIEWLLLTSTENRRHARGNARRQGATGLPRQLRPPTDPAESLPLRDVLSPLEVRGTMPADRQLPSPFGRFSLLYSAQC